MSNSNFKLSFLLTNLILLGVPAVLATPTVLAQQSLLAQSDIRTQQVQFQSGATSATVEDAITGYETVDYVLNARAGQTMNVSMATDNSANYFNILAPGENEVALFNGSTNDNQYEGILSETGDYKIRVYLMRSAARRNEVANYRLEMMIGNSRANSEDALVEGTNYHATGNVPCSIGTRQPTSSCSFGVTREGNGSGSVTIEKPDGRTRIIFFQHGTAVGYDQQAGSEQFKAQRQNDLNIIYIGQERYEIPDVVIWGD